MCQPSLAPDVTKDDNQRTHRRGHPTTRRHLLAATAGGALGGLAGCTSVTDQEFTADAIVLPEDARGDRVVAERARNSNTTTREVSAVDAEVTITNRTATYVRGPARGHATLMEAFVGNANGRDGPGSAVVTTGRDLGLDQLTLDGFEGEPTVDGGQVSVVAPEQLRSQDESMPDGPAGGPLVLTSGIDEEAVSDIGIEYVVDMEAFLPSKRWEHMDYPWTPSKRWLHVDNPYGSAPAETTVLVALGGAAPEEVFGVSAEEMPGRQVDSGAEADTGNNPFLVAAPGSVALHDDAPFRKADVFGGGVPAPMGGATFGLGVLSTPAAEVGGQAVNPLAGLGFTELLASEQARGMLKDAGVTDAEEVEWLTGPSPAEDSPDGTTVMLDTETELRSFTGVVSGQNGPWGVGVHAGRVEHEGNVVITAATHRWPATSPDAPDTGNGKRFTAILGSIIIEARELTTGVNERLIPVEPQT